MTPARLLPCSRSVALTYGAARVGRWRSAFAQRTAWWRVRLLAGGMALGTALLAACGEEPPALPLAEPLSELWRSPDADPLIGRACVAGRVESCSLTLAEHDGMVSCYEGTRSCQGGVLGPCENGYAFTLDRSSVGPGAASMEQTASLHPLSFSTPTECLNNPCNSYCREFIELPMGGLVADPDPAAPPLSNWPTGGLGDYPAEWLAVGVQEPCQLAGDCQFNTSCVDPALGSCSHSACSTGEPLITGCNRCADTVCAVNADCCGEQPECIHDPCDPGFGAPLDEDCDPCVQAVCAAHPECCGVSWDSTCVSYIATECAPLGQSCGCPDGSVDVNGTCFNLSRARLDFNSADYACEEAFGIEWTLAEIDDDTENEAARGLLTAAGVSGLWLGGTAQFTDEWTWLASPGLPFFINDAGGGSLVNGFSYENWADGMPTLGAIGHGVVMGPDGQWHDEPQSNELDYICQGPRTQLTPRRPTFSWGQECVDLAVEQCGVQCPADIPLGLGACVSRLPTELDPVCTGFDLALGGTCEDAGLPMIPVCNHGQTEAPVGLRLSYLPISEFGSAAPNTSAGGFCNLNDPIPPGRCVVVSDCPGLTADSALVVNPADGTENTAECRLTDNWSVYQPLSCSTPVCEAGTYSATQVANSDCSVAIQNPLGLDLPNSDVQLVPYIPQPHCAEDEVLWGASCYFFSTQALTWDQAENTCRSRSGQLVSLNWPAENEWVRSATDLTKDIQIGLNDKDVEGLHAWSNGSCRSWNNWDAATSQPDDPLPGSEQCARMTAGSAGRWEDTTCNDDQHLFVCEMPVREAQGACAADERMGPDGNCYYLGPDGVTIAEAKDTCLNRGPGWDLVLIDSVRVHEFVTGLLNCTPTWIAGMDPSLTGMAIVIGDQFLDELGFYQGAVDGLGRGTLCRGPALPPPPRPLAEVPDSSLCSGADEFYFEGASVAPEALTLCPATCVSAQSLNGGRLDVEVPCADPGTPVQETTIDELYYEADCEGGGTIWDFFYYDAVTPADSRIEFEVRTAPTLAELQADTIPFTPIAQAHAIPTDTQRCEINPPNCPIDVFTMLGSPSQQYPVLELKVKLVPGTSGEGPLLRDWRVRFSCPPSQ